MPRASRWLALASCLFATLAFAAEPAAKLAEQLGSGNRDQRREASYELSNLGPGAKDALPALIKALDDQDKQVWSNAVAAIANLGPDAASAIPALLDDLDSRRSRGQRDRERRQALFRSAYALTRIGTAAISPLIGALKDEDIALRQGAAKALGGMGAAARAAIPALTENLGHADAELRQEVAGALAAIGSESVKPLIAALGAPDPLQREAAALALGQLGPGASETAPRLAQLLEKETAPAVRAAYLVALPKVGFPVESALPLLLGGLKSDDAQIRRAATNALLSIRAGQPAVITALSQLLKGPDPALSERAAYVLGRFGSAAKGALPALLEVALRMEPPAPTYAEAIAQMGTSAAPALLRSVEDRDADTITREHWTVRALAAIGTAAVPALTEALAHPSASVRLLAARTCGEIGVDAAPAVPALLKSCADADPRVRAMALGAVVAARGEAAQVLARLDAALKDTSPIVRSAALLLVPFLGPAAKPLGAAVSTALQDPAPEVRAAALAALGPDMIQAVPALVEKLGDAALQPTIIDALGRMGGAAEPAVPRLIELLSHTPKETRLKILSTLANTGSPTGVTALTATLKDPDAGIRAAAITAFVKAERDAGAQVSAARTLLADGDGQVRRAAALALTPLGERAQAATPELVALLEHDGERDAALEALRQMRMRSMPELLPLLGHRDERVRVFACERLGRMGQAGREAIPALQQVVQAETQPESVRREARRAVRQLERR